MIIWRLELGKPLPANSEFSFWSRRDRGGIDGLCRSIKAFKQTPKPISQHIDSRYLCKQSLLQIVNWFPLSPRPVNKHRHINCLKRLVRRKLNFSLDIMSTSILIILGCLVCVKSGVQKSPNDAWNDFYQRRWGWPVLRRWLILLLVSLKSWWSKLPKEPILPLFGWISPATQWCGRKRARTMACLQLISVFLRREILTWSSPFLLWSTAWQCLWRKRQQRFPFPKKKISFEDESASPGFRHLCYHPSLLFLHLASPPPQLPSHLPPSSHHLPPRQAQRGPQHVTFSIIISSYLMNLTKSTRVNMLV